MSSAPAILDPRKAWLAARRNLITASDAAAILGADPHRGPLAVWAEKVGGIESEETLPMRRGRRFESAIAEEYDEQTGRPVAGLGEFEIQRHPEIPWLGATLDRITWCDPHLPGVSPGLRGERAPLQIKMALGTPAAWKDGPPLGFLVQVQIEIACYRATWGSLAGLLGPGPLHVSDHRLNEGFIIAALPALEAFRLRVLRREPPEADSSPGTSHAIRKLWASEDGETIALDNPEDLVRADDLDRVRDEIAAAKARERLLQNQLRCRIGSNSFGSLSDGSYLALKTVKRSAYEVEPTEYRALSRFRPKLRRR